MLFLTVAHPAESWGFPPYSFSGCDDATLSSSKATFVSILYLLLADTATVQEKLPPPHRRRGRGEIERGGEDGKWVGVRMG
mmetsp:Transcript_24441/g.61858  ORF Transcript_24441/g.61858 Transcript_24441/m.61858 type:complete len:81 (-) Transcript_24441:142-384(-)